MPDKGTTLLRERLVRLSMFTYTPINYWENIRFEEIKQWEHVCLKVSEEVKHG